MYSYALAEQRTGEALLLSADRDLYQAVNDRIAVVVLGKGASIERIGPEQVRERYGVEPEQVADFIALRGDPSDGLPGAPGIGAKTAAELLREHRTLEALLEAAERALSPEGAAAAVRARREGTPVLRARTAQALAENAELLRTFKLVATLQRIDVKRPRNTPTDFAGGASAARELGMRRLSERLEKLAAATART